MEMSEIFGVRCYRMKDTEKSLKGVYRYDNEPEESAHWLKSFGIWQTVTREKIGMCAIKKGEIVQTCGYLYGSKQALEKAVKELEEMKESPFLGVLVELFKSNVLSEEQALERMLRHTNHGQAMQLLQSV